MVIIRGVLFAVFAFMGTLSLSAQQNWLPAPQAASVIMNEISKLNQVPAPTSATGLAPKEIILDQHAKTGCATCKSDAVKKMFLERVLLNIKLGDDTGTAVIKVRDELIASAQGNAGLLNLVNEAYQFAVSKLS
jgi:hypothetical protein